MARTKGGNAIPGRVNTFLGDVRLEKGRWGEGQNSFFLLAWDFAEDCTGNDCPIYEKCYYMQNWKSIPCEQTSKCALQQKYLKNVMKAVVEKMQKNKATEETVIKLGYHLIPLYAQLFKFKMWETYNREIIVYSQGSPKVHPVYKEMREIIKTLTSVWKDIGSVFKEKADPSKVGDGAFIDAMYSYDGDSEEVSSKGSGIDFESEDDNSNDDNESGSGASGFEVLEGEVQKKKRPRRKQKNYHKKKRTGGTRAKAKIHVPGYNSRAHRKHVREGAEEPKGESVKEIIKRRNERRKKRDELGLSDVRELDNLEQKEQKKRSRKRERRRDDKRTDA